MHHLSERQRHLVDTWFPDGVEVVGDLSWGLVDTVVLQLRTSEGEVVLKAGGPDDRHIGREIDGYAAVREVWADLAPRLLHADREARVIVVSLMPGVLAQGTAYADDPAVHRQAGAALAAMHAGSGTASVSNDFEAEQRDYCRRLLASRHRIDDEGVAWLTDWLDAYSPAPVRLVPTHGDYSPRNWLVDADGRLRVIDLGRFALRPSSSDLCRLQSRHWRDRPDLAAAFVDGYGDDPRTGDVWISQRVREAVGTATWALQVGDEPFEREGHRMIADLRGS